jgi:hypothetical protein
MKLLHYSRDPITEPLYDKDPWDNRFDKPRGFWVTVDGEHCWKTWCISEDYYQEGLRCAHEVTLKPEARILILSTEEAVRAFSQQYRERFSPSGRAAGIDWKRVAEDYDGIIITPYQWGLRLDMEVDWYYTWDCASGCIWSVDAIESVKLLENVE